MITRSISVLLLVLGTVSTFADAFLDAALLLDRLKVHYWRSSSKTTSHASAFYLQPPLAYIKLKQLHKRKDRRKSYLLAGKQTTDGTTTARPKTKHSEILFQQRLSELKDFIDQNGHGSIPTPYDDNPPLGVWAANLRRQFVIREHAEQESTPYKGFLTEERMKILKESGFDFTSLTERQFNIRLDELKKFKERYGHTLVPEKYEENMALGAWVSNMRTLYKKKRLETDVAPVLEEKENDDSGIIKVRYSKNLLQQEVMPVKKRRRRQRSKRNSQLDDEKERLLNELQFVWNAKDRKWFEMLEWAKVYAVVNYELTSSRDENSTITMETVGGSFNRAQLNERDTLLLDNYYTFVKNIQDPSLLPYFHPQDEILDLLRDENYVEGILNQTQHLQHTFPVTERMVSSQIDACPTLDYRVPVTDTLHYSLRIWMVNQRSNYHRRLQNTTDAGAIPSTMTDQRQHALDEINFPWSGRFANRCEEIQYEIEQEEKNRIEMEKARRREQKLKEEQEKIAQLKIRQDATPLYAPVTPDVAENDIMSLWSAGDEDEDDDIW